MSKKLDITGQTFHDLTVLSEVYTNRAGRVVYTCQCVCGNKTVTTGKNLRSGNTKSCGCRRKHGSRTTHGMSKGKVRLYSIWLGMKQRCYYKKSPSYKRYGGRGVKVTRRWESFENFYADMSVSYTTHLEKHGKEDTTLDRINNDGNYCKSNCQWATRREQWLNSRSNKK